MKGKDGKANKAKWVKGPKWFVFTSGCSSISSFLPRLVSAWLDINAKAQEVLSVMNDGQMCGRGSISFPAIAAELRANPSKYFVDRT